jgi:hypothetical protein
MKPANDNSPRRKTAARWLWRKGPDLTIGAGANALLAVQSLFR